MDKLMEVVGDEPVKATNCEAAMCKASAVARGYWRDEALERLTIAARLKPDHKPPEISRGYYARVFGMRIFIDKFMDAFENKCQIVNLGCGFDTLFWKLYKENKTVDNFIELDFPSVTARKCHAIKKEKVLMDAIAEEDGDIAIREGDLHSNRYHLLGCDLRNLSEVQKKLEKTGIRYDAPTLFIAECVLVYIKPEPCQQLLKWLAKEFPVSMLVSYEQVNMKDKFGEVMLSNLNQRGCPLAGAEFCATLQTQNQRFLSCGWEMARSWDMESIWDALPFADRHRIESLEMLDEEILLTQLFQHYCIVIAMRGQTVKDIYFE